jgi:hypothetical protein
LQLLIVELSTWRGIVQANETLLIVPSLDFPSLFVVPGFRGGTEIATVSEGMLTTYRFGFLQATLRKPNVSVVGVGAQWSGRQASEAENSQASRRRAARQNLIEIMGDKLSEYGQYSFSK